MIRNDYIMRMIDQMTKILARVLLNKKENHEQEALQDVENGLKATIEIDPALLDILSVETIAELLGVYKNSFIGSMKCIVAAKFLKEKAEILSRSNEDASLELYDKSFNLYLKGFLNIDDIDEDLYDFISDVKSIDDKLREKITIEEMFQLFMFYVKIKQYDKAEDVLFILKEHNYPDIINTGRLFFNELKEIDEVQLKNIGLTKEEVDQSLDDFLKH